MSHTPGPWRLWGAHAIISSATDSDGDPIVVSFAEAAKRKGGPSAGLTLSLYSRPRYEEAKANALLMASAPDLLQALEAVEKLFADERYYIGTREGADPLAIDATMLLVAQAVRAAKGGA